MLLARKGPSRLSCTARKVQESAQEFPTCALVSKWFTSQKMHVMSKLVHCLRSPVCKHMDMHDVHDVYFLSWLVNHLDTTYTCTFLAVMELMVRLARMESPLGNTVNDSHDHPQGQQLYTISQRWMSARFTPRISLNLDRI